MTAVRHGLTPRQLEVFNAIVEHHRQHGVTPTYRQLIAATSITSLGNMSWIVNGLVARGYIVRLAGRAHSIAVIDADTAASRVFPPPVEAKLDAYCRLFGEDRDKVIADAVALHLDELGERFDSTVTVGGGVG
jgi:SOS-response transcriptional repressor LexA